MSNFQLEDRPFFVGPPYGEDGAMTIRVMQITSDLIDLAVNDGVSYNTGSQTLSGQAIKMALQDTLLRQYWAIGATNDPRDPAITIHEERNFSPPANCLTGGLVFSAQFINNCTSPQHLADMIRNHGVRKPKDLIYDLFSLLVAKGVIAFK